MNAYKVRAVRWSEGWELHIDGEGVTQVRTLERAAAQVRDYLGTMHEKDFTDAAVEVIPDLDGLEVEVVELREEQLALVAARSKAAQHSRSVARRLREQGLSVSDTATVMGVSRGRISQLV